MPATAAAQAEAAAAAQIEATPQINVILPSFDVVRVERSGAAVIAGRAAPGSEVTLRAGSRVLGTVTADNLGQWVLVLETLLEPGSYELSLESRLPGGEIMMSESVVVISVPHPQIAAAEPEAPEPAATLSSAPEPSASPAQPAVPRHRHRSRGHPLRHQGPARSYRG